jgi:hypothetical protein
MSLQAIWRLMSRSWLVAAPLIILFLAIAVPIVLGMIGAIVDRVYGPDAAERLAAFWLDAGMWTAELTLLFAPIALAIYATFRLARWLVRRNEP